MPLILILLASMQDRAPEPSAEVQKDTLKLVRDLFKEDYAKKTPADQRALSRKLLAKGVETADDPAARYVLLREARDLAAATGDVDTAVLSVDETARHYSIDGAALKLATLSKMAAAVRDPDAARAIARALVAAAVESARADGFETAAQALGKAEPLAKTSQDLPLAGRIADLKGDVASLKSEAARVKPLIGTAAPADAEALGRWFCLAKGDWDKGLPHLVAAAKAPLKTAAERDAAMPSTPDKMLEAAEGWLEVAAKEKSGWRRSQLLARARYWLQQADAGAAGLLKMRVAKRAEEAEEIEPGMINLLRLVDPRLDVIEGEWASVGGSLSLNSRTPWARVEIPYLPPDEYELTIVFERKEGDQAIGIGLGHKATVFSLFIDGFAERGGLSGLDMLDGFLLDKNPSALKGLVTKVGTPCTAVCTVRKTGVTVTVDGKPYVQFPGPYSRLTPSPVWRTKTPRALLLGAYESRVVFTKAHLYPLSGQGKKLR